MPWLTRRQAESVLGVTFYTIRRMERDGRLKPRWNEQSKCWQVFVPDDVTTDVPATTQRSKIPGQEATRRMVVLLQSQLQSCRETGAAKDRQIGELTETVRNLSSTIAEMRGRTAAGSTRSG